jgi:pimeloyl-ACP methyl ester carboxylesterase
MGDIDRYRSAERALWARFGLEPQERVVEAGPDRTAVRVVEVGEGPPAVFVGGTGGTGPYWAPLLANLRVRAIIIDRPGFGLSAPVDYERHAVSDLVPRVLGDVLDAVEVEAATVVGASIGNVWALTAAEQLTDRVSAVVLLGGGPLTREIHPPPFIRLLRSPLGAVIVRVPQRPKMLQGQLRQLGHGPSLDAHRFPDEFIAWSLSLTRDTRSMRHERAMDRAGRLRQAARADGPGQQRSDGVGRPVDPVHGHASERSAAGGRGRRAPAVVGRSGIGRGVDRRAHHLSARPAVHTHSRMCIVRSHAPARLGR